MPFLRLFAILATRHSVYYFYLSFDICCKAPLLCTEISAPTSKALFCIWRTLRTTICLILFLNYAFTYSKGSLSRYGIDTLSVLSYNLSDHWGREKKQLKLPIFVHFSQPKIHCWAHMFLPYIAIQRLLKTWTQYKLPTLNLVPPIRRSYGMIIFL